MKRGNYKDYLSHGSKQKIPRTTAYNDRQKRIAQLLRELRSLGHNVEQRVSASHDSSLQRPPKKCYENPGFLANENISRKSSTENMNKRLYHQNSVPPEKFDHFVQNDTCIDQVCNEDPQCCTFNQPTFWPNSNQMYNENDTSESSSDEDTHVDESEPFYREMYEHAKRKKERDAFKKEREFYRLKEPLCHCSTLSRGEIMYMVMQISLDNDCTWKTVEQYSKLINFTHGKLRGIPDTKYKIQKYFPISDQSITFHMYCSRCKKNLGEQDGSRRYIICTCGFKNEDPTKFFLSLNFENSFRDLLETSKNIEEKLNYRFNRKKIRKKGIEEIMDRILYKELEKPEQPLSNKMNFSYTFSTDGCQSADSSKATIWPIFASVNELKLNPADKSMLLLGVWVDLSDPDMNLFLEPFVEKANLLSSKGVEWKLNGKKVISKILPIMSSVDSVCRPKMMCMKKFNGYNGCYSCKIKGKLIDNQVKYVLTTDNVPESRTDEETKEQMIRAFLEQTVFDGVKGPSILMYLNYFRLVKGMIPDPLHAIHRGASAQHTRMLLHSCGEPYYVGAPAQIALINKRLKKIKPPSCITRTPRPIDQESLYKASEWRSWTELYSLVCLEGILDKDYLIDLAMHVKATHILLQESVLKSEIREAHSLYVRYNVTLQFDYGENWMTSNVHLLLHVCEAVENWGPMWINNSFKFENENRIVLMAKKSPKDVALQIARKYLIRKSVEKFGETFPMSLETKEFVQNVNKKPLKFSSKVDECTLIGSGKVYTLSDLEKKCLNKIKFHQCTVFEKLIINNIRFTSAEYTLCTETNDCFFETKNGDFGYIEKILSLDTDQGKIIVLLFQKLLLLGNFLETKHFKIDHIKKCSAPLLEPTEIDYCLPNEIIRPYVFMPMETANYIASVPKGCLGD